MRGITVLYGALTDNGASTNGQTWEWNGSAWIQRQVVGPPAHYGSAMAFDSARGVMVRFGGFVPANGETWEWNGVSWNQRATTGPAPRGAHAMVYDTARGVTVLFGGRINGLVDSGETWEWNGAVWTLRPIQGPSPRYFHAMVYDASRGVTVLYGGASNNGSQIWGDTWELGASGWTQRSTIGPTPRYAHAMAYDTSRSVSVLFGGNSASVQNNETWDWNGTSWTQRPTVGPTARQDHAMTFDSLRGDTVLFGGYSIANGQNNQTWTLCGLNIESQPSSQTACPRRAAVLSVAARGFGLISYRWRKGGVPLDLVAHPTAATPMLVLRQVEVADQGSYDCLVSNGCGSIASEPANISLCAADFNGDGSVDPDDLSDFITAFFSNCS